jgi:hypothetical protein
VQFCHEITYVISGKGTFLSGEARDDLQQGDIHLISKGVSHKIIPQERSNLRFANIGFEFTEDLPEALVPLRELFETNPHLVMRDNGEVRILMTMLLNEMQNEMEMSHQRAEWCIKLILSHIYRMATTGDEKPAHSAKSTTAAKLTPYAIIRYVDTNLFETFFFCADDHSLKMVDVGVNVTVREKSQEVESTVLCICNDFFPGVALEHSARFDSFGNELCALREDLSCAESVVTDLGVAHVVIGGKTYSGSVRFKREAVIFFGKHIESGGVSRFDSVALNTVANADAVHYDSNNRTFFALENSVCHNFSPFGCNYYIITF